MEQMCLVAQLKTFKQTSKYGIVRSLALCFATIHPEIYKIAKQYKSFLPDETNKAKRRSWSCFIMFNNKVVIIIHYIDIMTYLDVK